MKSTPAAPSRDSGPSHAVRHVAIIMDGNGRWAKGRGQPRVAGHRAGGEAVRRTIEAAIELGIPCLTLYSFSSENWRRPQPEVDELMELLRRYLKSEMAELHKNNVRLRVIGERQRLPQDIVELIEKAEQLTAANTALTLCMALNYGSRAEIVAAARQLAARAAAGELEAAAIDEAAFAAALYTHDLPDPDILIRTSGEQRLSNFLLWQNAYAEMFFVNTYWPDFGKDDLMAVLEQYQQRERRYGAL